MQPATRCMKYKYPHVMVDGVQHEAYHLPVLDYLHLGLRMQDRQTVQPRHHSQITLIPISASVGAIGLVIDTTSKLLGTVMIVDKVFSDGKVMVRNQAQSRGKLVGPCDRWTIVECTLDKPM
jgi:hypothetical protein